MRLFVVRRYSLVAWPQARQSAEYAARSWAGLVQTANVTRCAHLVQPPATCRQGSHRGDPEVIWKTRIQGGDVPAFESAWPSAARSWREG